MDFLALGFWLLAGQVAQAAREGIRRMELQSEAKLENHATRIARLEAAQITHEDLGKVYRRLDAVGESCSEMKGDLAPTGNQLSLVFQYLRGKAKG